MPPPHLCHLSTHPQYPARSPVKSIFWDEEDSSYAPVNFTHAVVLQNDRTKLASGWADPAEWTNELESEVSKRICLSQSDGTVPMHAHRPRNPKGRTGMTGRGLLGKYGPNAAADAMFLRTNKDTGRLQIILIVRADNGAWSMPGGMIDAGETPLITAKREFIEEALANQIDDPKVEEKLDLCFNQYAEGRCVYSGYVDDPRNTDLSWMETTVFLFYIEDGNDLATSLPVRGGDDAVDARWVDFSNQEPIFKNMLPAHHAILTQAMKTDYFQNMKKW